MSIQTESIRSFIASASCVDEDIRRHHQALLEVPPCTRDEGALRHFCVYFIAIDTRKHVVFLGHHKKANLWLANGGHIDTGETVKETLMREISEEWGVNISKEQILPQTRISVTAIENERQPFCKEHMDLWHVITVDSTTFHPIEENLATEFYETRWMTIQESLTRAQDANTIATLHWIATTLFSL